MTPPLAHSMAWLEVLLFAPAFLVVLVAVIRDRRARRAGQAGSPVPPPIRKD
jgi:hypothetical protein